MTENRKRKAGLTLIILMILAEFLFSLPKRISCNQDNFSIVGVVVRSSSGSEKIYPGSRRVSLRIEAAYMGSTTARSVTGHLKTVEGIDFSAGSGPSAPARSLNGSVLFKVEVGDHVTFDYYLDISKSISPGTYTLTLNITYRLEGNVTLLSEAHSILINVSIYPEIQLRVIDAYLSPSSSPGSVNTNLYVLMENVGESSMRSADFELYMPSGFTVNNPRARVGAINIGDRFTITFSGISVPLDAELGQYYASIHIDATMVTEDNVIYDAAETLSNVSFYVANPPKEDPIIISSVSVLYQGSPAPLLPSANGLTIRVVMINRLPEAVSSVVVRLLPPSDITVRSISGTYVNGMAPGGSCYLDMTVDVSSKAQVGRKIIPLNISYVRIVSGSSYMAEQSLNVTVMVESHHSYVPEISLISAYWGSPNPTPVYGGSQYVPLTLRFINDGRYDIIGARIKAESIFLDPVKNLEALAARLTPGSYASATLYFNVNADGGRIPLRVLVNYFFEEFGVHLNVTRVFEVYLLVEKYSASASNLAVVSSGWQNNYNVFPRTENATYQVTLANRAPFSIGGIFLSLRLPENISSKGDAYIEGPIRSLGTFTASFMISVGCLQPGKYNATLIADFILLSGGPGIRCIEKFNLTIAINDDSQAVEFISAGWYEGSVGPNTYGAHLIISLRNNFVDNMRGAILELNLPEGLVNALDNTSRIKLFPVSTTILGISQPMQTQDLSRLISAYSGATQAAAQTFSRGDVLTFVANIHVLNMSLGIHNLMGDLSYIDQWGTKRSIKVLIPIAILGRTEYIDVSTGGSLSVRSRFTNISLSLWNRGSSPVYNVYLVISPYRNMPILMASPAVTYIRMIGAGERVDVPVNLAYNPLGFTSQIGGTTTITYGPVPLMISLIYRDASGALKSFNNTLTVVVEPFIDLLIKDVRAIGKSSTSTVSGTIINYGSATAYRVKAIFQIENESRSTLVGDVAPGDELAFRIDLPKYGERGMLRIEYYNIFNELAYREILVSIEFQPEKPITSAASGGISIEAWIVVAAVIAFLSLASFLIYRVLKSRSVNRV